MMRFRSRKTPYRKAPIAAGSFSLPDEARAPLASVWMGIALTVLCMVTLVGHAIAGGADVVGVKAAQSADKSWRFDVSVLHADAGWDHYADKWAVFAPDGTILGERILLHPHDNEQPFTRSQSGIIIPDGVTQVTIKAHDKVHGWDGEAMVFKLP